MRTVDAAFQAAFAGHLPRYGCDAECRNRFCLLPPDQMLPVYAPNPELKTYRPALID
jgi:hypothetical protein